MRRLGETRTCRQLPWNLSLIWYSGLARYGRLGQDLAGELRLRSAARLGWLRQHAGCLKKLGQYRCGPRQRRLPCWLLTGLRLSGWLPGLWQLLLWRLLTRLRARLLRLGRSLKVCLRRWRSCHGLGRRSLRICRSRLGRDRLTGVLRRRGRCRFRSAAVGRQNNSWLLPGAGNRERDIASDRQGRRYAKIDRFGVRRQPDDTARKIGLHLGTQFGARLQGLGGGSTLCICWQRLCADRFHHDTVSRVSLSTPTLTCRVWLLS